MESQAVFQAKTLAKNFLLNWVPVSGGLSWNRASQLLTLPTLGDGVLVLGFVVQDEVYDRLVAEHTLSVAGAFAKLVRAEFVCHPWRKSVLVRTFLSISALCLFVISHTRLQLDVVGVAD